MTLAAEQRQRSRLPATRHRRSSADSRDCRSAPPGWFSQHLGTAVIGAVLGYTFSATGSGTWWPAATPSSPTAVPNSIAVTGGSLLGAVGWLLGIGALNYPLAKMVGLEPRPDYESTSWTRYFRYTADHKVVGLQYVIGVLIFFFTGGLLAMAIRTELLSPTSHVFGPGTYIAIVSEHGTIMMMMATSVIVGPARQLAGAAHDRRPAHGLPRVEAFSFWIFSAGYFVILSALFLGGFPPGGPATRRSRPRPAWG